MILKSLYRKKLDVRQYTIHAGWPKK